MPNEKSEPRKHRSQSVWTWVIPLAALAVLGLLYSAWPGFRAFTTDAYRVLGSGESDKIRGWVEGFGGWGFAVILTLMLFQTLVPFLPSVVTMVVAVLGYGPVRGGLLAWGGLLLAACLGYGIGRAFGPVTVDRLIGAKAEQKMERFVDRYGVWAVIAARIAPMISTDAVSIVAGLAGMTFWRFLLATAAGTLPLAVLVAWLGADIQRLGSGLIWASVVSLFLFGGYVVYDHRKAQD